MGRSHARTVADRHQDRRDGHGFAHAAGWYCFLAFVAVTPLILGSLPPQLGPLALFHAQDPTSLPKVVTMLVLTGVSFAALCVSVIRRESELRWHPVLWIMVGLFVWAAVSTAFSASPARSVLGSYDSGDGLVAVLGYVLVAFLAIQYVRSGRHLRIVAMVAVVSGSIVAAYALLQYFGVDPIVYTGGLDRVISTFGNPDMLGDYLVFPFALALGLALSARGRTPVALWFSAAALTGTAVLVSGTRGAWLGAGAVVVCIAALSWRRVVGASRRQKLWMGGLAVAVIGLVALAFVYASPLAGRSLGLSGGLTKLSNGRNVIWLTGLRGWLSHPITGWGPDSFGRAFQSAVGPEWYAIVQGLQTADNAHNFLIEALVTLGIPGLLLTGWALVQTAVQSFGCVRPANTEPARPLPAAIWAALLGLVVALVFGVTLPGVSVWLWLAVGLLLAPIAHELAAPPKAALAAGAVIGVALALWAGSWLVADVFVGWAMQQQVGPDQVSALQTAVSINPISPDYRWLYAEALVNLAMAERAGQSAETVDAASAAGVSAFYVAAAVDRGDPMVRVALAGVLLKLAAGGSGDAAQRAVQVAQEAVRLAPHNPAALVVLARAFQATGRGPEAEAEARLARSIAPAYAGPLLGSLGLGGAATP